MTEQSGTRATDIELLQAMQEFMETLVEWRNQIARLESVLAANINRFPQADILSTRQHSSFRDRLPRSR
jgi:hypothetical protein